MSSVTAIAQCVNIFCQYTSYSFVSSCQCLQANTCGCTVLTSYLCDCPLIYLEQILLACVEQPRATCTSIETPSPSFVPAPDPGSNSNSNSDVSVKLYLNVIIPVVVLLLYLGCVAISISKTFVYSLYFQNSSQLYNESLQNLSFLSTAVHPRYSSLLLDDSLHNLVFTIPLITLCFTYSSNYENPYNLSMTGLSVVGAVSLLGLFCYYNSSYLFGPSSLSTVTEVNNDESAILRSPGRQSTAERQLSLTEKQSFALRKRLIHSVLAFFLFSLSIVNIVLHYTVDEDDDNNDDDNIISITFVLSLLCLLKSLYHLISACYLSYYVLPKYQDVYGEEQIPSLSIENEGEESPRLFSPLLASSNNSSPVKRLIK
jgi:hypothetical protein